MIRIGVDPGKKGFICIMRDEPHINLHTIKYEGIPLIGKEINLQKMSDIFSDSFVIGDDIHCVIEDVHAIYGSSAKATFTFGWVVGALEALLVANNIPYTKVTPKNWQKVMWVGIPIQKKPNKRTDTKAMSLLAAKRLFPNEDLRATKRSKIAHDGKVDSLLLAEYCKRNF